MTVYAGGMRPASTVVRRVGAWLLVPAFLLVFCLSGFAGFISFGFSARAGVTFPGKIYIEDDCLKVVAPADGVKVVVSSNGNTDTVLASLNTTSTGNNGVPYRVLDGNQGDVLSFPLDNLGHGDETNPPYGQAVISSTPGTVNRIYAYYGGYEQLTPMGSNTFMTGVDNTTYTDTAYIMPMADGYILYWATGVGGGYMADSDALECLMLECGGQSIMLGEWGIYPIEYHMVQSGSNDTKFYYAFFEADDMSSVMLSVVRPTGSGYQKIATVPVSQSVNTGSISGLDYSAMLGSTDARAFFGGLQPTDWIVEAWVGFENPEWAGGREYLLTYREAQANNLQSISKSDVDERFPQENGYEYLSMTYSIAYQRGGQIYYARGSGSYYPDWLLFMDALVDGYHDYVDIRITDIHSNTLNGVKVPYNAAVHGGISATLSNGNSYSNLPLLDNRTVAGLETLVSAGHMTLQAPCFEAIAQPESGGTLWDRVLHGEHAQEPLLWFVADSSNIEYEDNYFYNGGSSYPGYSFDLRLGSAVYTLAADVGRNIKPYSDHMAAYFDTIGDPPAVEPEGPDAPEPPDPTEDHTSAAGTVTTTPAIDDLLYDPLDMIEQGLADVSRASAFTLNQNQDGSYTLTVNLSQEAVMQADEDGYTTFLIDLGASGLDLSGLDADRLHYQVNIPESAAGGIGQNSVVRLSSQSFSADIPWNEVNPVDEIVEITVDVVDLGSEVPMPFGRRIGADVGTLAYAAYAARQVGANTRSLASSAYNISVSKVNTQTQQKTQVTTFAAKPVVVSIPQTQIKTVTASATTRTALVAKKYNESNGTWESRPTVVSKGKVTFFSNSLSIFAIFETQIEAEDIGGDYDNMEILSFLLEAGVVQGTDTGTIEPYRNVRLSELAAMLVRMDNTPVEKFETQYPGVLETRWYYNEINTALLRGYITQEETFKNPDKWATVEEHVRMLFRYKSRHSGGVLLGDQELEEALSYALATGLLEQELLLDLNGTVTREETFLALLRLFLELYGNEDV